MTKELIVIKDNRECIEKDLRAVNGRSRTFTVNFVDQIFDVLKTSQFELDRILPKEDQEGVLYEYTSSYDLVEEYKFKDRKVTKILFRKKQEHWVIENISSVEVGQFIPSPIWIFTAEQDRVATNISGPVN